MEQILPNLYHWVSAHPRHKMNVSSYYWEGPDGGVVIDPFVPEEGLGWFDGHAAPRTVYLTNRHHYRRSGDYVDAFGATVWCQESGLHEFTHGESVQGFAFGDTLPGGGVAHEVGSICSEETAVHLPGPGALAMADGLIRHPFDGPLGFVPHALMGEDWGAVERGLLTAFRRLLGLDFDTLLFAHGAPWVGGAKAALAAFVEEREADTAAGG